MEREGARTGREERREGKGVSKLRKVSIEAVTVFVSNSTLASILSKSN